MAYAISYVRQFEAFVGERDSEALFNGMESEVSEPVAFIFKRLDFRNDDHGPSNASAYQTAAFDFSSLYSERTTNPLSLGRAYRTSGGTENTTNIREDSPGGLRIGYLESEEGELITALTDLADTEKIVFRPASGTDVVFTLSADNAVADNPATPDAGGFLSIASTSYTKTGTFIADTAYNLYPANSDGTIKGAQTDYPSNLPPQITGINIYRSTVVNEKVNAISFDQLTDLFENNPSDLDLSELLYRKIAYISRDELNLPFVDGLFALKGDDEDELVDSGDAIENITGYRPYYHTVEFDETDFSGVIVQPPPGVGIKESYNLPGIVVSIYGAGAPVEDIIAQDPLLALRAAEADSVYFYKWSDGLQLDLFDNQRLPPQVKQIHYHGGRIYAPRGDTLIYSHFDGTIPRFEAFPPKNDLPRPDGGRVTFCASHREVLLFGASDGLFRLTGQDRFDFATDQIGASGPLDGYSWGVFEQTIGFISDRGFHISDAASVDLVSDESLDGFLRGKTLTQGAVGFFTDNTLLFLAQTDDEDLLFLFDDKHWVRWKETALGQFAPRGGEIYVGGGETLKRIALGEESTAVDLAWSWESNLIHGQEAGASNVLKRFTELCIAAAPDTDMKLKTWINDDEISVDKNFTTREIGFDRVPQVVPIERVGQRLRFRLEGKGPVEIRGLEVRGEV